jgi:hypothetical protein
MCGMTRRSPSGLKELSHGQRAPEEAPSFRCAKMAARMLAPDERS